VLHRSTIQLLRFHFSLFLLPVYLFAVSQVPRIDSSKAIIIFVILHLLVYPSSNGYNSYMDRDTTPIGGLEKPLQPTRQLYRITYIMDMLAVLSGLLISMYFSVGILLYILASRAYSSRQIRLKRFPVKGFLTVFICQGALVFYITYMGASTSTGLHVPILPCIISSCLIAALYPLTQIYQHKEDKEDGVTTISYLVGKRGTFILSMGLFLGATFLMYLYFAQRNEMNIWFRYLLIMLPVVLFFLTWMRSVWISEKEANFKNSLSMNVIATLCTTIFFVTLILYKL
jgi:1,4-dihydroxy-2-naphthoate polyprenyltransferase